MYPTITHMIEDLTGLHIPLPIQTFGFMMAISFLLAAWTLYHELKRKHLQGLIPTTQRSVVVGKPLTAAELLVSIVSGFIVGYKFFDIVFNYAAFSENPQEQLLSLQGSWLGGIIGAAGMGYWKYYERKKAQLPQPKTHIETLGPHQLVPDITMVVAVTSLIGAKIFDGLENWDQFVADPWGSLFSFSGLTFYGGLIFGTAGVLWYVQKNGIRPLVFADAAAPGVMLAYGVGRLGCQLSGDGDWGIVNTNPKPAALSFLPDWAWSYTYPNNVLSEGIQIPGCVGRFCAELPEPVYPTPLYEFAVCVAMFGLLWFLRKRIKIVGMLLFIYLFLNGLERFFIEKIRVNSLYNVNGFSFTQAELISTLLMLTGIGGMILLYTRRNRVGGNTEIKTTP
ncbi:MAG TPA: prolipoprotein diacylglyceryl transferase family protein [Chitinophagales bacterium]|nr:prolipoprotein diacylglyceryl transferase family protein [Chitinophagales bacterium]